MKRILMLVLTLALLLPYAAWAQSLDVATMTDEELLAARDAVQAEIDRRAAQAREEAALREADAAGEIICRKEENRIPEIVFATDEQLYSRLHKVTLTMDNWSRYLGDYYYPHTVEQTNNFGEVTRAIEERAVGFHYKEGYIIQYENVGMKFTGKSAYNMEGQWNSDKTRYSFVRDEWKDVGKEYVFDLYNDGLHEVNLGKYQCTAVTGTLYVLEVPKEVSKWLLESNGAYPWAKIYVGDRYITETDGLRFLYDKLNP